MGGLAAMLAGRGSSLGPLGAYSEFANDATCRPIVVDQSKTQPPLELQLAPT